LSQITKLICIYRKISPILSSVAKFLLAFNLFTLLNQKLYKNFKQKHPKSFQTHCGQKRSHSNKALFYLLLSLFFTKLHQKFQTKNTQIITVFSSIKFPTFTDKLLPVLSQSTKLLHSATNSYQLNHNRQIITIHPLYIQWIASCKKTRSFTHANNLNATVQSTNIFNI
jgi:predicted ATP-dependent protease